MRRNWTLSTKPSNVTIRLGGQRMLALGMALWLTHVEVVVAAPPTSSGGGSVVAALTTAAQREFDAGNFARAGELFLEIWQRDRTTIPALYNAARACQLAGQLEKADSLYVELQALPNLPAGLSEKCTAQRSAIRGQLAERRADNASAAERSGNFRLAAELYGEAFGARPERRDWLLRRARALDLAGQRQEARTAYEAWLAGAAATDPDRPQVQMWLAAVARPSEAQPGTGLAQQGSAPSGNAAPAEPAKAMPVSRPMGTQTTLVAREEASAESPRWLGWTVLGVGVVAAASGGGLMALTRSNQDELDQRLQMRGPDGRITGISYEEAAAEAQRLGTRYSVGWALAGTGAVAAVLGAVLVLRSGKSQVSVAPTVSGGQLAIAF